MQTILLQQSSLADCKKKFKEFLNDANQPKLHDDFARILPPPNITGWTEAGKRNNCLNYALDLKAGHPLKPGEIHGELAGDDMIAFDDEIRRLTRRKGLFNEYAKSITQNMKSDGFVYLGETLDVESLKQAPIALFLKEESINNDFHFYSLRFDQEKQKVVMCHKFGASKEPEILDSKTCIFNHAKENSYQHFVGFWGVDKEKMQLESVDQWGEHNPHFYND